MTLRQYLKARTRSETRFTWLIALPLLLGWVFAPWPYKAAFLIGFFACVLATNMRVKRIPCPRCGGDIRELALAHYGASGGKFLASRRARLEALGGCAHCQLKLDQEA